jgi:hypothetical protein
MKHIAGAELLSTENRHITAFISALCLAFLPFSVFLGPISEPLRYVPILICVAYISLYGLYYTILENDIGRIILVISVVFLLILKLIISVPEIPFLIFYISAIVGLLSYKVPKDLLINNFKHLLLLQIIFQIYESITGSYLFDTFDSAGIMLDEKTYAGISDVFRAKGMLDGPTTLGALTICISIIAIRQPYVIILSILSSVLALARFGIFANILILFFSLIHLKKMKLNMLYLTIFLIITPSLFYFLLNNLISLSDRDFIYSVFSLSEKNNDARFFYITQGFNLLSDMSFVEHSLGLIPRISDLGFNFENAYLTLWVQSGFLMLLIYLYAVIKFYSFSKEEITMRGIIFFGSLMLGFFSSIGLGILYFYILRGLYANETKN